MPPNEAARPGSVRAPSVNPRAAASVTSVMMTITERSPLARKASHINTSTAPITGRITGSRYPQWIVG